MAGSSIVATQGGGGLAAGRTASSILAARRAIALFASCRRRATVRTGADGLEMTARRILGFRVEVDSSARTAGFRMVWTARTATVACLLARYVWMSAAVK